MGEIRCRAGGICPLTELSHLDFILNAMLHYLKPDLAFKIVLWLLSREEF